MNKLIDDLSQQAEDMADLSLESNVDISWLAAYTEHLSQLIVKKCISICIEQNVSNLSIDTLCDSGKFTIQDLATKSCGKNLANIIGKTFGINHE